MAHYTRPTTRRSYDAIQTDINEAAAALAHSEDDRVEYWRAQVEVCGRLRDLWNEITWQAADDKTLPPWARFAASTTRDHFATWATAARAALLEAEPAERQPNNQARGSR